MADLFATPSSASFGNVSVGGAGGGINIALAPRGPEGVSVYSVTLISSPVFTLVENLDVPTDSGVPSYGNSTLIDAGTSRTITVNFKPLTAGLYLGTLRVRFNGIGAPNYIDIPLSGTGV